MDQINEFDRVIIKSILHPNDFSAGSLVAFHHALKAALIMKSRLTLMTVSIDGKSEWSDFPGVRETLERWGLLPNGSPQSAVGDLGVDVHKVIAQESNPVDAVLRYQKKHPSDLIVLATHQREGRIGWLGKSVVEPVARGAWEMTLFIPDGSDGFIAAEDGSVHLRSVLIPVAQLPRAQPAINAATRLIHRLNALQGTFTLLHVGNADSMPTLHRPKLNGWTWEVEMASGDVIHTIVNTARDIKADLIVMSTDGRNGFLDGLRGSHSERVLRHGVAPLLTIPLGQPHWLDAGKHRRDTRRGGNRWEDPGEPRRFQCDSR